MKVYIDKNDLWVGVYRGPNHWYVCPIPCLVFRFARRRPQKQPIELLGEGVGIAFGQMVAAGVQFITGLERGFEQIIEAMGAAAESERAQSNAARPQVFAPPAPDRRGRDVQRVGRSDWRRKVALANPDGQLTGRVGYSALGVAVPRPRHSPASSDGD